MGTGRRPVNPGAKAAFATAAFLACAALAPCAAETGAPLRTPDRVASGAVTESRATWNTAVQRITYLSSADNTPQPMMFYKPQADEPRPLLVGLHSWSE